MRKAPLPEHLRKGSFSLRAADKAGVSRTRTEANDLVTVSRGIRMHLGSEASGADALRAYTELDDASVLAVASAARMLQVCLPVWLEQDWRIHVARRRGFSMPRRVNVVGHLLTLLPGEVIEYDGVRLTSPARTWLDLASVLAADELVIAGDSLVCSHGPDFPRPREPMCTVEDLRAAIARHPGMRGIRTARSAVELVRVGSDSQPETRMRLHLIRSGLPEPVLNYVVTGVSGRPVLWPDAAYPAQRVAVQYEGSHHNAADQYLRDIRRADIAAEHGWLEVRVSKFDLAGDRPAVVGKVRAALQSRGWRAR
ncbi:hypothetical protein LFT45_03080 [Arthrobacter sp. FW305-BF8]|uniref:hypothetical protein n=1 Tax=Arthrobacter sp. FW305-BF8 TaxID=2879617 RepID=UPI001F44A7BC|nr:hypothetical protein [Arthrobacter sp. FW305-BF8]UKA54947.1 hypothetical protein LFT45_03080 [Arthrobacter sp. FW305-BF8]